ncbi:MAG: fibronectin type III domain-containing protein [Bacteroides sp.]|uniref:fibronectin type III domain-containing protein n=1 Tax=Bacteroides sp. TaxID=29523 RepID=UPI0025BDCEF7|nr:fibronectin type III domain-containing protein [Bacteroides sp.]MBS6240762.1 fibronectin type III domain-containing protein [Bacteroides sp.]
MKRLQYIIWCSLLLFVASCEKDTEPTSFAPVPVTGETSGITRFEATLSGTVTPHPDSPQGQKHSIYFLISSMSSKLLEKVDTIAGTRKAENEYTLTLKDLKPGTTYYYSIESSSGHNAVRGTIKEFTTLSTDNPSVTLSLTGKTESSISVSGIVTDEGGATIQARGFVYKLYTEGGNDPTLADGTTVTGESGENGSFMGIIKENILPETAYIIRAYATNNDHKTGYSQSITVTTNQLQVPSLTTGDASDLTAYSAMLHATFLSDNGFKVTERGFCYSAESQTPTIDHPRVRSELEGNDFTASVSGLEPSKTYYYRAYAINEKGTGYGETKEFTLPEVQTLTLSPPKVSDVTTNGAIVTSSVNLPSGASILEKGISYSTSVLQPTIEGEHIIDTTEGNNISVELKDLIEGRQYYVCAYAISRDGTFYSVPAEFSTVQHYLPTVEGLTEIEINDDNATMEARLTDNGGMNITECGFCWDSSSAEPDITRHKKVIATLKDGVFQAQLTGLAYNTSYHVRAYAVNGKGVGYSAYVIIKTGSSAKATIADMTAGNPTPSTLDVSATVSTDGGAGITERGFVYSSKGTPSVEECEKKIVMEGTVGEMSTTLTGLAGYTNYSIRAYAVNKNGTAYSNTSTARTKKTDPSIDDPAFPGTRTIKKK